MPRTRGWGGGGQAWRNFTPGMGPGLNDYSQEFGVFALAGAGANPRFLWPGGGRTGTAQPEEVGATLDYDSVLNVLAVRQGRPPAVGAAMLTYQVLVEGVAVAASVVVPATSSAPFLVSGLGIAISAGQRVSVRVTRDINHTTVMDVFANLGLEVA